jgi:hypothetical protein
VDHRDGATSIIVRRLDDVLRQQQFWESKFIKIDTDGYDAKVIRGGSEQIAEVQPVIFFEYDPHCLEQQKETPLDIFRTLDGWGYRGVIVYDNVGDLLFDTTIANRRQLEEITAYFSGWKSQRYCDICAFHRDDDDLWEKTSASELEVIRDRKRNAATLPVHT